jgi:hypothetical protein
LQCPPSYSLIQLQANMLEGGGKTPILSPVELEEIGYKIIAYPLSLIGVSMRAMEVCCLFIYVNCMLLTLIYICHYFITQLSTSKGTLRSCTLILISSFGQKEGSAFAYACHIILWCEHDLHIYAKLSL